MAKIFIDTNILIYSMDSFDPEKRQRCRALLKTLKNDLRGVISTQVMQEFYVAATKKLGAELPAAGDRLGRVGDKRIT